MGFLGSSMVYGICLVAYSLDKKCIWTVREKKTCAEVAKMEGDISMPMGRVLPDHDLVSSLHRLQIREMGGLLDLKLIQDKCRMYVKHGMLCVSIAAMLQPWEDLNSVISEGVNSEDIETIGWMSIEEFLERESELRYGAHFILSNLERDAQENLKLDWRMSLTLDWQIDPGWEENAMLIVPDWCPTSNLLTKTQNNAQA